MTEEDIQHLFESVQKELALSFINYIDEHRYDGKMSVSNAECDDIVSAFVAKDWAKINRYYTKFIKHPTPRPQFFEKIVDAVAKEYYIDKASIFTPSRLRIVTDARHIIMYIALTHFDLSVDDICRYMGRSRSAVTHGIHSVSEQIEFNKSYRNKVHNILERIKL